MNGLKMNKMILCWVAFELNKTEFKSSCCKTKIQTKKTMERRKGEREGKRPNFLWLLLKKNFLNDFKGASTFANNGSKPCPFLTTNIIMKGMWNTFKTAETYISRLHLRLVPSKPSLLAPGSLQFAISLTFCQISANHKRRNTLNE